jgi:diacylglycerol kinase
MADGNDWLKSYDSPEEAPMRAFARSFRYALRGVALCLRERNFRFHVALAAHMYGYLLVYDWFALSRAGWAAIILSTAMVLACEALNTALEAAVNLASPAWRPLAARAKDAAAAAVLLCAMGAVAVGLALLSQPAAFRALFEYYRGKPLMLLALSGSLAAAGLFVFPDWGKKR